MSLGIEIKAIILWSNVYVYGQWTGRIASEQLPRQSNSRIKVANICACALRPPSRPLATRLPLQPEPMLMQPWHNVLRIFHVHETHFVLQRVLCHSSGWHLEGKLALIDGWLLAKKCKNSCSSAEKNLNSSILKLEIHSGQKIGLHSGKTNFAIEKYVFSARSLSRFWIRMSKNDITVLLTTEHSPRWPLHFVVHWRGEGTQCILFFFCRRSKHSCTLTLRQLIFWCAIYWCSTAKVTDQPKWGKNTDCHRSWCRGSQKLPSIVTIVAEIAPYSICMARVGTISIE